MGKTRDLFKKIRWRRKWQPTPVFLPGKVHGQWSLVATVHQVTKSPTQPSNRAHMHICFFLIVSCIFYIFIKKYVWVILKYDMLLLLLNRFSRVRLFMTPWTITIAHQAPLSIGFSRQEYWSGLLSPSLAHLVLPYDPLKLPFFKI